jgi:hypothetical protein
MDTFYLTIIILFAISSIAKTIIHIILDSRNGYKVELTGIKAYIYLLPYDKEVDSKYEELKKACNLLQKLQIATLFIFVITFFIRVSVIG